MYFDEDTVIMTICFSIIALVWVINVRIHLLFLKVTFKLKCSIFRSNILRHISSSNMQKGSRNESWTKVSRVIVTQKLKSTRHSEYGPGLA